MSKKNKLKKIDPEHFFVYSTDPDYVPPTDDIEEDDIPDAEQKLLVRKERKGRGGKVVTIVDNYRGSDEDRQELAKAIKQHCGTGGSVKEDQIVIQGDRADQIVVFLLNRGLNAKKTTM